MKPVFMGNEGYVFGSQRGAEHVMAEHNLSLFSAPVALYRTQRKPQFKSTL